MRIIVVGAGIIGAAIADLLARRGAAVTVLDARAPGRGASQASAGILAPYTEAHQTSPLLELGARSLALYDDFVSGVVERSGRAVEYARTGTLEVAFDGEAAATLQNTSTWLSERGIEHRWMSGREAQAFEPAISPAVTDALFIVPHGFVEVRPLVSALMLSARLSGAILETGVDVTDVTASSGLVEITAGDRRWGGDAVVIAAGSWSRQVRVNGAPVTEVRPVRGQLLHLRWRGPKRPQRIVWGPSCYAVPLANESMLIGATVEDVGFDESSTLEGIQELMRAAVSLLPAAAHASLEGVRVGLRPQADGVPIIGPLPDAANVIMATGHYRNGILLAPLTAELVSRYVFDGVTDPATLPRT